MKRKFENLNGFWIEKTGKGKKTKRKKMSEWKRKEENGRKLQ